MPARPTPKWGCWHDTRLSAAAKVRCGSKCEELEPSICGLLLFSKADVRADVCRLVAFAPTPDMVGLLDQLAGKLLQVLELGVEASCERVHRAAVGVVGGVGDELVVEADAHVG